VPDLRPLTGYDLPAAEALLDAALGGRHQARLGEVVDVLALPGIGAWDAGRLVGLATWAPPGPDGRAELAVIGVAADRRGTGIGAALVEAAAAAALAAGATLQFLVTTNDNLDALRLYQRHGYRLAELRPDAIATSRLAKPSIPATGAYGIPLRDELVLERRLSPAAP
jgi:ribosomal protein S18 acetylase RimI-like enzyme